MKRLNWTRTWLLCSVIVGASWLSQVGSGARSVAWGADDKAAAVAPGGTFSGEILLGGEIPTLEPVATVAGPKGEDLKTCGIEKVPSEKLVVNPKNKGIANCFVYLKKAPAGMPEALKKSAKPTVTFDQKNLQFLPHALLVRTDQTVEVISDDPVGHNTHTTPLRGDPSNFMVKPKEKTGVPLKFKLTGNLPFGVQCDIHPWMKSWWLVSDHPYAAITDADGKFVIHNLPPGEHDFMIWQESVGYIERRNNVKIKIDGKTNPAPKVITVPVEKFKP